MQVSRRALLSGLAAVTAIGLSGLASAAVNQARELPKIKITPPIGTPERMQRLGKARALMQQHGIGAMIVESGPSLDYFTGVQWWRSEGPIAAGIPLPGASICAAPLF